MAPPVPVYSHADVGKLHKFPLDPATGQPACPLKELTQYECEVYGKEIVCVPFKRLFRAYVQTQLCLVFSLLTPLQL